ncbi:uncharacterized protein METZ01_LOCUS154190, partial [marine metagenome]
MNNYNFLRYFFSTAFLVLFLSTSTYANDPKDDAPIVQPGAPGQSTRDLDPETAIAIANSSYTPADVNFLQGMITHHHQAMIMSDMATDRTNSKSILDLAGRIDVSQEDEINFMQTWLREREENVPNPMAMQNMDSDHNMMGMATPEQLDQLAESKSIDFDKLFLSLMITHHDGAIKMVEELRKQRGSAYDPILNEFATDVTNDQAVEIERMNILLVGLSDDPRASLSAGLHDADVAIKNLEIVTSLTKPVGFYDPENPSERYKEKAKDGDKEDDKELKSTENASRDHRYPMLSFSNTDLAFRDNILVAGSYHGFNIYRIDNAGIPSLVSSVICPGGQGDVSIVENLLIMSVEQTRGRLDCGLQGAGSDPTLERFLGIRIF